MTAREVLDGIKGRLTAATPGPWVYDKVSGVETVPEFDLHRFDIMPETVARIDLRHEDGEFIAAAPVDVARLTRAVEAVLEIADYWERTPALRKGTAASKVRAAIENALNP